MDILNFISWIKGGRVVTTVDPAKTLLPVGLKDNKRDDGYLAGAISVEDFAAQLVPPVPEPAYKVYTALLSQTGTNPPVATVLENTLGVNLTFSYLAAGVYTINNLNGWDRTKLWYGISGLGDSGVINIIPGRVVISIEGPNPDMLIVCYNNDYSSAIDQQLVETPIEIRVYN
jgi:hypothetical protein